MSEPIAFKSPFCAGGIAMVPPDTPQATIDAFILAGFVLIEPEKPKAKAKREIENGRRAEAENGQG